MVVWYRNYRLKESFLTSSQGDVFHYVLEHEGFGEKVTTTNLMSGLQLGQSTLSGIISRLESKGIIKKVTDEKDARRVYVVSTRKGRELEDSLKCFSKEIQSVLFRNIPDDDVKAFKKILPVLLENLSSLRNEIRKDNRNAVSEKN